MNGLKTALLAAVLALAGFFRMVFPDINLPSDDQLAEWLEGVFLLISAVVLVIVRVRTAAPTILASLPLLSKLAVDEAKKGGDT